MVTYAPIGMVMVSSYRLPPMVIDGFVQGPKMTILNGIGAPVVLMALAPRVGAL